MKSNLFKMSILLASTSPSVRIVVASIKNPLGAKGETTNDTFKF